VECGNYIENEGGNTKWISGGQSAVFVVTKVGEEVKRRRGRRANRGE